MHKHEFFKLAMKSKLYEKTAWVINLFSITRENKDEWKEDPYPYRIVQSPTNFFYVDPTNKENLLLIEGVSVGSPILEVDERLVIDKNDIINYKEESTLETTVGLFLLNYYVFVNSFKDKFPYVNIFGLNITDIEEKIAKNLYDEVPDSEKENDKFYVSELIKFNNSVFGLANFCQLFVWAGSEKVLIPPPGIKEYREKIIKEENGDINDPATLARIEGKLIKYDAEFLKGDPSENFLISNKSRKIVRKKKFLMFGGERGLTKSDKYDSSKNSLYEGWEIDKLPAMINSSRAGSYNRGAETQLGGESVKWLLRASSNIFISEKDCGSVLGEEISVNTKNISRLVNTNVITNGGFETIKSEEEAGKYLGKLVSIRSPMYCKLSKTDYCEACCGPLLSVNPSGLSLLISDYGSAFLGMFMAAMHGKVLETSEIVLEDVIF